MDAHGNFDIWLDNRVLLTRVYEQSNIEFAIEYVEAFQKIAQPLIQGEWAHIAYLDSWGLAPPETERSILQLGAWAGPRGLKRVALVFAPNKLKAFQLERMIPNNIPGFERRFFSNEAEAFAWLEHEGYPVNHASLTVKT